MQSIISQGRPLFVLHAPHLISPLCCRMRRRGLIVNLKIIKQIKKKKIRNLYSFENKNQESKTKLGIEEKKATQCRCGPCGEGSRKWEDSKRRSPWRCPRRCPSLGKPWMRLRNSVVALLFFSPLLCEPRVSMWPLGRPPFEFVDLSDEFACF